MSDLVMKILDDKTSAEEVSRWMLGYDLQLQKEGYTKTAFARYLLDFIRKQTCLLLPKQEPFVTLPEMTKVKPLNSSTPLKAPLQESTPQNFKSVLSSSTSFESRSSTPASRRDISDYRSRTSFSSSCNSTPTSRNLSSSSPSMELLERRLTSRDNSKNSPKPLQLKDFIVIKEKPKKKNRRVKPIPCDLDQSQENMKTPRLEVSKTIEESIGKQISPVMCNRVKESPDKIKEPIKIMKRVPFVKINEQIQQNCSPIISGNVRQPDPVLKICDEKNDSIKINTPVELKCINEEHKILIGKLALLYSAVITSNYCQDLLKELNFLMSLLSSTIKYDKNDSSLLKTEENILTLNVGKISLFKVNEEGMYFAALVLEQQWNLLRQLNTATLSILAQTLKALVPEFADQISHYAEERKSSSQNVSLVEREMLSETVKFKMDTDCRPNYVNDQLFYAFKKQRDEFYSLLQEWEEATNKRQSSTEFFKAKLKKLKSIVTISTASTNMHRLADLFVSQILASVFNENNEKNENLSVDGITSSKFDLLNRRFVAPTSLIVGQEKRFPGVQEFFKDFLRSAESSFFSSHVRDVLIQRIILFNNFNISSEVSVASIRQELYLVCINKLCLLAKFLSLVSFLPYQDKETLPPHLRIPLVDARKHTLPPLDLDSVLTGAIRSGRILISLPWIVEFLIGIDDTSIQLPCYKIILAKLQYLLYEIKLPSNENLREENIFCIYTDDVKSSIMQADCSTEENKNEKSDNRMNILRLKELASKTTNDLTKRFVNECLQTLECARILITLYVNSLFNAVSISTIINMEDMKASMNLPMLVSSEFYIDNTALYQSFPQLYELKSVLEGKKKLSHKSITPKTEKTFCDHQTNEVALDMQLEMHFFDNMSHSVKNTVDIVAKQVSSHCVGMMRDKIIPELKTQLCEHMKIAIMETRPKDEVTDSMLTKFYTILRRAVDDELSTLYSSVENSLKGMLKPDVREDNCIFNVCVDVTCRKCIEITYNWIFNYINFDSMVEESKKTAIEEISRLKSSLGKSIDDKKSKKSKTDLIKNDFNTLIMPKNDAILWTCPGPVKILHRFRHLTRIVITNSNVNMSHEDAYPVYSEKDVTTDDIECLIQDSIQCIERRADLQFIAFRRVMLMSVDMIAMLVFLRPKLIELKILQLFQKLWTYRKDCKLHLHFEQVLSSRNIEIYSRCTEREQEDIRRSLDAYLCFTLKHKIMHTSRLFRQVLKLLQHEWPDDELLRPILIRVKEALEKSNSNNEKIMNAMESIVGLTGSEC